MSIHAAVNEDKSSWGNFSPKKREEKTLREFKDVLYHLVLLLREAAGAQTVYQYWINRARRQFVMETQATAAMDVNFQDRVNFDQHFLDDYRDIRKPVSLKIGQDIPAEALSHYSEASSVHHLTLLPSVNNDETVAMTVVESESASLQEEHPGIAESYITALGNVLNTYLEISDLHENQQEWVSYEEQLDFLNQKGHYAGLLQAMLDTMQPLLEQGGVSLVCQAMGSWCIMMNAAQVQQPLPVGLALEEGSLAKNALENGTAEFAIHFNQNPKRLSPREPKAGGATLAIPMLFDDFRKAVVLAYDENPLIFKESTKHKLKNIVRLTSLEVQTRRRNVHIKDPLLTNEYDAIVRDGWERMIDGQVAHLSNATGPPKSWVGLVTFSELSKIRTQFRLDDLNLMQRDLVHLLNPSRYGVAGFVGFHADYLYLVFINGGDGNELQHWKQKTEEVFSTPLTLSNGKKIRTGLKMNFIGLTEQIDGSFKLISKLKKGLTL